MLTTRRERKKERGRSELIDCAVGLFRKKGFNETSIDDILSQADISKGTLYNYFQNKESILVGYFQQKIAVASVKLKAKLLKCKNIEAQLGVLLDFMHQILVDDIDLAGIYFSNRLRYFGTSFDNSKRSGMESLLTEIIQAAQARGELRADLPATFLARNFQFLATSFLLFDTPDSKPDFNSLNQAQVVEFFLNGAGAK